MLRISIEGGIAEGRYQAGSLYWWVQSIKSCFKFHKPWCYWYHLPRWLCASSKFSEVFLNQQDRDGSSSPSQGGQDQMPNWEGRKRPEQRSVANKLGRWHFRNLNTRRLSTCWEVLCGKLCNKDCKSR